jgi:hypothetical protein
VPDPGVADDIRELMTTAQKVSCTLRTRGFQDVSALLNALAVDLDCEVNMEDIRSRLVRLPLETSCRASIERCVEPPSFPFQYYSIYHYSNNFVAVFIETLDC